MYSSTSPFSYVFQYKIIAGSFLWSSRKLPLWGDQPGGGLLDGNAPFYDTYKTKDGLYMSVGALEPKFYAKLLKGNSISFRTKNRILAASRLVCTICLNLLCEPFSLAFLNNQPLTDL